jgi:uncharacterized beta-barrel protein YwiB (DUF1934 family)
MIKAIVFSNNSPKLLDIFLQSAKDKNIKRFEFSVLYKSEDKNSAEYLSVFEKHNILSFEHETTFKDNLLFLMNQGDNNLISFFKDTNYFFSEMPDTDIEKIMSDQDIFCFSMTLGKNITHCYHNDVHNILLNDEENSDNTIKWNWVKHYLDFGRPLELGAGHTFYKKEIVKLFKKWSYNSIQELEESFDKLDYYPKELMSGFKKSILVDVISKSENPSEELASFDFNNLDRIIIEI